MSQEIENQPIPGDPKYSADLQAAFDDLGAALTKMIHAQIAAISHDNMRGFLSAMVNYCNNTPLANQQLVFCVNDLQTYLGALAHILESKGLLTKEELDQARLAAVRARIAMVDEVTKTTLIAAPPLRRN